MGFDWLANSFYVLVALAVVYLYFFRIVPIVADKVGLDSVGSTIQMTLILIVVAILIGFVSVRAADWIFVNVLYALPGTRMAEEIDRVTGPVVNLTTSETNTAFLIADPPVMDAPVMLPAPPRDASAPAQPPSTVSDVILKPDALEIWAGTIQARYNPTGDIRENQLSMTPRDIPRFPQQVTCDVNLTSTFAIVQPRRNETWLLSCQQSGTGKTVEIQLNGTAASSLISGTSGTVRGTGEWPQLAIASQTTSVSDLGESPQPVAAPQGGPSEPPAELSTNSNGQRIYTVQDGDSLAAIAAKYNVRVWQIVEANASTYPSITDDNNFIRPGWSLVLPTN